ncbi:phosphoribosylaminoimidazolesuccinocarboxamide synthase [Phycisphaera mikurensis]|uniref:Phosphoribosylaminoimidazole-succinocarboxamide synthase n=1 Tax=Phycisphaera mikurensis (strain NBRC 102666 / KCTC 22515 / FYK2301M01) TaxID=1142394 RepID=I0IGF6_PHYMF|nr:phosphoribosylaminoimidazolesuccinocarboxamide synthase [Phycisphaera mikurensis]MBB6442973.1 phosphoribosylaminoimidazole-succinocarboxamide synthase [Phycisphaera mikurensis]BAM04344.1 phosphoribosylaminoimidazole-succinocarboxamide synthase [Phycisphaera mikurensis NBRC 102666]
MRAAASVVTSTDLPLPGRRVGKVRDVYACRTTADCPGGERDAVLLVATDRLSAFDVVLPTAVPGKGPTLTRIAAWWFAKLEADGFLRGPLSADPVPGFGGPLRHHLISTDPAHVAGLSDAQAEALRGRVMIGLPAEVVPVECVVRGYLTGSGWSSYRQTGHVCGVALPVGLVESEKLPEPIFTPTTKAERGAHDAPVSFEQAAGSVGLGLMTTLRDASLALYAAGAAVAEARGVLLADTKFEFGLVDGTPVLVDEALTPDSSRFWPAECWRPGAEPPSFDKQFVRSWLLDEAAAGRWNKAAPGPELPPEIVQRTAERYAEAEHRLTSSASA